MNDIIFYYNTTITKNCDEFLSIETTEGSKLEGAFRIYEIPNITRSIDVDNQSSAKVLIEKTNWSADFLIDDPDNPSLESASIELKDEILSLVRDQDGEDYEDEGDTKVYFCCDGMMYEKSEIIQPPDNHNAEELFDMPTSRVEAILKEIEIETDKETKSFNVKDEFTIKDKKSILNIIDDSESLDYNNALDNPNCPIELKIKIVKDPNCPSDIIDRIVMDDNFPWGTQDAEIIKDAVASNPNTSPSQLQNLYENAANLHQKSLILKNPNCPADLKKF